jgi:gliding motility-associated protein GldM
MGATNCPETPRQRMISMMYLVLTAMLALNVSIEILNGYSLVDQSLRKSIDIADQRNVTLNSQFKALLEDNKTKTEEWKIKADSVVAKSDGFFQYVRSIQDAIIFKVDGSEADLETMTISEAGQGDLNITGEVEKYKYQGSDGTWYEPAGKELRKWMNDYSDFMQSMVTDSTKKISIKNTFATEDRIKGGENIKWETGVFEGMPAIATLTLLTKIQNDIRNTEAEVVQYLKDQIDAGDFRVNKIEALVIPNSKTVIRGGKYHAQIVLAATDSTRPLEIKVNDKPIEKGIHEFTVGSVGSFKYSGVINLTKPDGSVVPYEFADEYIVTEPTATVSADMMNVFYAGIDNPLSVSVPGVAASNVSISVSNGRHVKTQRGWNIRPTTVGQESVITVSAMLDGKSTVVAKKAFRVKPLPPPLAKIEYKNAQGHVDKYKGGTPIAKNLLLSTKRIVAELDDDDLEVKYKVISFNIKYFDSMGLTLVLPTSGPEFTAKQMQVLRDMIRGKSVYVSDVVAIGPDNIKRTLPPLEIVIR